MGLTIKQEKFCHKYIECGVGSDAYRFAYCAEKMKDKSIWEAASKLLTDTKVAARMVELKAQYAKQNEVTVEEITQIYRTVIGKADQKGDLANHRGAASDMAKLHGLVIERRQVDHNVKVDKKRGDIAERWFGRRDKDKDKNE